MDNVDAAAAPLPPHWRELTQPQGGPKYYFNTQTMQTTWQRPQPEASYLAPAVNIEQTVNAERDGAARQHKSEP